MAKDLLTRLRERAMAAAEGEGGHLTDAEMGWFQAEQARQREARDADEAAQREAAMRAAKQRSAQPPAYAGRSLQEIADMPYEMTRPEMTTPQELVNAHVRSLQRAAEPDTAGMRYEKGRQQVAASPITNIDPRTARDALIRASGWVNPMDLASMVTDAPLPGSSSRLLNTLAEKETLGMSPEQLGRRSAQDDMLNAAEMVAGAAALPSLARSGLSVLNRMRGTPRVVPDPGFMRDVNPAMQLPPPKSPYGSLGAPKQVPQLASPPAGPYGGEDLQSFLQRLNRDMDEINAPRPREPFITPHQPMPREQMELPMGYEKQSRPVENPHSTQAWLRSELRNWANATPGDINRIGRLRRLDKDISDWGDIQNIPQDVLLRNMQTAYSRPFQRKGGLGALKNPEQMVMSLPEAGRVAKEQPILIDPWGQNYFDIPATYRSGGSV